MILCCEKATEDLSPYTVKDTVISVCVHNGEVFLMF